MSGRSSLMIQRIAGGDDQLGIDDVADAFEDRPLGRLGTHPEQVACVRDELPQRGRARPERRRQVVIAERREQRRAVCVRCGDGIG